MPMTATGTELADAREQARQRELDDFRKNAAYNALVHTYGPAAGDPVAWDTSATAQGKQDAEPYVAPTAEANLQKTQLENADTSRDQQGRALYGVLQMAKAAVQPDGSVDSDAYDRIFSNPMVQKATGITPEHVAQAKGLLTAPGGVQHLDTLANAALGPAQVTGAAIPVQNADGTYSVVKTDKFGRSVQVPLNGAQPVSALQGAERLAQGQERIEVSRERVKQAAKTAGISLTAQGLQFATEYLNRTGEMINLGMGSRADKVAVVNNAAAKGATGNQVADAKQHYKSAQAYETDLAKSSPTSAGGLVRSAGAVFQHIDTLDQYVGALQNKNIRLVNALSQKFKTETGKAAPNSFDLQKTIVGDELSRYLIARGGTGADRKALQEPLAKAKSPQQLRDAIKVIRDDIGAQLYSQYSQAKGFGKDKQFLGVLTPEARFILTGVAEPGHAAAAHPPANDKGVVDYRSYFGVH